MRKRIAYCITELDPGGAEWALWQLARRLDRTRWEPTVYCLSAPGPLVPEFEQAGVPVVCLGARRRWDVWVVWRLTRELRRLRPAILHSFLFAANIVGRVAGRRAGVPWIISSIRVADKRSRWRLWLDRATAHWVDRHVCVSRGVARYAIDVGGLPPGKTIVIPNGVDFEKFARAAPIDLGRFGIPPRARTVSFVGRLDPQKGPLVLLEALPALLSAHPDVHVLMVGDGPLRPAVEARIAARSLAGRVHLVGRQDDIAGILRASTVFVLASLWEGMPNVLLEAMAAGVPVVATSVEGTEELVTDGLTGVLVPPGMPERLAAALSDLLSSPQRAQAMAQRAQDVVAHEFTWDVSASSFDALYSSLLAGESAQPVPETHPRAV